MHQSGAIRHPTTNILGLVALAASLTKPTKTTAPSACSLPMHRFHHFANKMANSFPFPFLQLPGETRNQIYSNLIDNGQLRDGEEEGLVDTWRIFGDGTHKRGMTCSGLVTLMRTCRGEQSAIISPIHLHPR